MPPSIVWFRSDLRVHDNPALTAALADGDARALLVLAPAQWRTHGAGAARLAFLLRCLDALKAELERLGVPLEIVESAWFRDHPEVVLGAMRRHGATSLHFNAEYPLDEMRRDDAVLRRLRAAGLEASVWHGGALVAPGSIRTATGGDYTVFTPFRRRFFERVAPDALEPLPVPRKRTRRVAMERTPAFGIDGVSRDHLAKLWPGGERAALARLDEFVGGGALARYAQARNTPSIDGTSRLSPYFALGALSVRTALMRAFVADGARWQKGTGASTWIDELLWREFYLHVTAAFPHVSRGQAFKRALDAIPWRHDPDGLAAWQAGRTGYPLVDAGMRELAATGWMHNRVRMVTAMFLSKHLLVDWREGERHFLEHLVDGDFAANNGGWQWSASTGTDAAPYFRVFNPVAQARKCDPDGAYVRRWLPELREAEGNDVFEPWRNAALAARYPAPIVDHAAARARAIGAFRRGSGGSPG
jgi:deoxyribodipyrimidine photo-lyase